MTAINAIKSSICRKEERLRGTRGREGERELLINTKGVGKGWKVGEEKEA